MRKQVLPITVLATILIVFTTVAYSHYKIPSCDVTKGSSCNKNQEKGEIIFESLMKQFVGAVKL